MRKPQSIWIPFACYLFTRPPICGSFIAVSSVCFCGKFISPSAKESSGLPFKEDVWWVRAPSATPISVAVDPAFSSAS